jgi:3'-phosphoadenosine 5'-phosphosulfate sulfotransferase (PAPS reductase)/FAD synthetase
MDTLQHRAVDTEPLLIAAIAQNPIVVFSISGGKDSAAAAFAANAYLDTLGHDRSRRAVIHADLGRIEWRSTPAIVEQLAARLRLPLIVVRRSAGDLIARWQQRFEAGKQRYTDLRTMMLVGPFSSSALRFCTSELKTHVIAAELRRRFRGEAVISVIGLRRDESRACTATPVTKGLPCNAQPIVGNGRAVSWHPIASWTEEDVYACHAASGLELHEAYTQWGATRMGCSFCVLASQHNLETSAASPHNREAYRLITDLEIESGFSFQPNRWLGDVAPDLLKPAAQAMLQMAKAKGQRRRLLESSLPRTLRFERGWPPRLPDAAEAATIAAVRAELLAQHGLPNLYPSAHALFRGSPSLGLPHEPARPDQPHRSGAKCRAQPQTAAAPGLALLAVRRLGQRPVSADALRRHTLHHSGGPAIPSWARASSARRKPITR